MSEKIKGPLYDLLKPDLVFISPFAVYNDRDKMIEDIWPAVGQNKAVELEIFGDRDRFMVKYRLEGQRNMALSEYIQFTGDKISRIEVYPGFEEKGPR
jgi:hypothetical protein